MVRQFRVTLPPPWGPVELIELEADRGGAPRRTRRLYLIDPGAPQGLHLVQTALPNGAAPVLSDEALPPMIADFEVIE
ncbi:hypothetical protein [Paracoccus sp. NSM]|uniref:hypothetical protein n=1 Tax=Paracoccus sp. NSM TaxID=3457784 RepID=UPI004036E713